MPSGYVGPNPSNAPAKTYDLSWLFDALRSDLSRNVTALGSGLLAPGVALTGGYNQREVSPTGAVSPVDPRMISDANNMAGMVSLGAPGMVPEGALGMGIKAYHGSPHSFDKFDMSKIGTGEGAQAYGHGLYFAENEGVAKGYQTALASRDVVYPNGKREPASTGAVRDPKDFAARSLMDTPGQDHAEAINGIQELIDGKFGPAATGDMLKFYRTAQDALRSWQKAGAEIKPRGGNTYAVDINAHPDQFLDWDKPLSAQPKPVQDALKNLKLPDPPYGNPGFLDPMWRKTLANPSASGADIHKALSNLLGSDQAASAALKEAGVPGISYLDAGSRGAGDGTRNRVVFDDSLVNIEKKYGVLGGVPNTPQSPSPALTKLSM